MKSNAITFQKTKRGRPGWRSFTVIAIALFFHAPTQSPSQSSAPGNSAPELVIQTGHSSRVNCAVFGPDGHWLATGSADNAIRLWDVDTGRELRALNGHKNWIKSLALTHNGELLASGSNDRTVKLWNVSSGREVLTLSGHQNSVEVLSFSPDDRWLVSGSTDRAIKVWNTSSGAEVQTLVGHTAAITALAFSPDGKTLASAGADNTIKLWDTSNWSSSRTLTKHTKRITALSFGSDGNRLISGAADGTIIVWDAAKGRDEITIRGGSNAIVAAEMVGQELLTINADGRIVLWNPANGKVVREVAGNADVEELVFAALSRNGRVFASSTGNKLAEIRDTSTGKLARTLESHSVGFFSVAFSVDGRWLATGTNDRSVRLWQIATGREMPKLSGHTGWVKAVAFSPDSRLLASGSNSGEIKLWDVNSGREIYSVSYNKETPERIHTIAFSPDGKWLASAGTGQTVRVLDVVTRKSWNLTGHTGEITSLIFIPKSGLLASGSTDKTLRLWDLGKGNTVTTFATLSGEVNAVAVSPDGTTLAAGTADDKIFLMNVVTREAHAMIGHTGEIFSLAFSPDGRSLASGGMDQVVRIWDPAKGLETRKLTGASSEVNSVAFSNDSRSIVSGNGDGSMIVWNVENASVAATLVSIPLSDDWLVAAPNGLFDGSHAAWKYLLWRFARSTFKVAPVESFFNEFYYPGLLADILAGKNPQAKRDIITKDRRQPEIRFVTTEAPVDNSPQRTVQLKLEVTEAPPDAEHPQASGARDLRLFRNGLLVQTWSGDVLKGRSQQTIETSARIVAGANVFTAYAFNRDNVKSADASRRLNGAETLRRDGTAYLIVVGVGNYENSQYNLNYSVADANAIGEQLKRQQDSLGRYRPIEVISLLNEEATKANILLALKLLAGADNRTLGKNSPAALLKIKPAQPEDAVVFYFSGHGTAQGDRFYLLPHDIGYQGQRAKLDAAGLETILAHSISDLELEEALKHVDVDQLLLVIDACNSGQALQAQEERRGPMNTKGLAQLAYEKGMYVLTASQSDEVAFESAGLKHSYLAHALVVEGIQRGAADSDSNGQVLLKEWFDYATERVPRIGREKNRTGKELEEVDADEQRVQRPRVFNMREGGAERFVVASVR